MRLENPVRVGVLLRIPLAVAEEIGPIPRPDDPRVGRDLGTIWEWSQRMQSANMKVISQKINTGRVGRHPFQHQLVHPWNTTIGLAMNDRLLLRQKGTGAIAEPQRRAISISTSLASLPGLLPWLLMLRIRLRHCPRPTQNPLGYLPRPLRWPVLPNVAREATACQRERWSSRRYRSPPLSPALLTFLPLVCPRGPASAMAWRRLPSLQ